MSWKQPKTFVEQKVKCSKDFVLSNEEVIYKRCHTNKHYGMLKVMQYFCTVSLQHVYHETKVVQAVVVSLCADTLCIASLSV